MRTADATCQQSYTLYYIISSLIFPAPNPIRTESTKRRCCAASSIMCADLSAAVIEGDFSRVEGGKEERRLVPANSPKRRLSVQSVQTASSL